MPYSSLCLEQKVRVTSAPWLFVDNLELECRPADTYTVLGSFLVTMKAICSRLPLALQDNRHASAAGTSSVAEVDH